MLKKVLIVKFGAIGDVVMAIPAAKVLHEQGATIDWVCGKAVAPVLACYPWIRTIVVDDRSLLRGGVVAKLRSLISLWWRLIPRHYTLCATLYYDPRYRFVIWPVNSKRKLYLSRTGRGSQLIPGRHHTDEYARIMLGLEDGKRAVGLSPVRPEHLPESPLACIKGKRRVVLAPAGARNMMRDDALRRWPPERYATLAQELLAREFEVVLLGGPDDDWVRSSFAGSKVVDLIGKLTLPETLALLNESDVIVTHDTGPLHLAGITAIGIVSIFGPTNPWGRIPQRANVVALWGGEGFACRPCYDGTDFASCRENGCMRQVTVAMVLNQVEAILKQRDIDPKPPRVVTPVSTVSGGWR